MCRSIKKLRKPGQAASSEESHAAAVQFVRKISGYHHPSRANQEAFDLAVTEIAAASQRLLDSLVSPALTATKRDAETEDSRMADSANTASRV